jgi:hypothetical protein
MGLLFAVALGCQRQVPTSASALQSASKESNEQTNPTPANGHELLRQVFAVYGGTATYRDRSTLVLRYKVAQQEIIEQTAVAIHFVRPNRMRLELQRADTTLQVVADGKHLWASVHDPSTENLRHQVAKRPAPERLAVSELYAVTEVLDPANPAQMLSLLLGMPINLQVSQLGWLWADPAVAALVKPPAQPEELPAADIGPTRCRRFQVPTASGPYVFWIDPEHQALRRIEYPTNTLFAATSDENRPSEVRLWLDLHEVTFQPDGAADVAFRPDDTATLVQYFVLPPQSIAHPLVGQRIPPLSFETPGGQRAGSADWAGRSAVLVWFDDHPASAQTIGQLNDAYQRYRDRPEAFEFRAVRVPASADPAAQPTDPVEIHVPQLRDSGAAGRDVLQIQSAPTLVVLDKDHQLVFFQVGASPQLGQALVDLLDQLASGRPVARELHQAVEAERKRFDQQLAAARFPSSEAGSAAASTPAAAAFSRIAMTPAWQCDKVDLPGNLLMVPASNARAEQLLVIDGMRTIAQLDSQGTLVGRQSLDADEATLVAQCRHGRDAEGRDYFACFSPLGRFVEVYDQQWHRVFRYPNEQQRHHGIWDVQLNDLDRDGSLELYVAFAAPHGCQRVDLQGRRSWSNRVFPGIVSLAAQRRAEPHHLLAVSDQGQLLPITFDGRAGDVVTTGQRTIHQLSASGSPAARPTEFLGLSYAVDGRLIAVGLDAALRETWSYGLPGGVYRSQLQIAQWAPLMGADTGYWLLAGPDGSIHVIRDDGTFHDTCHLGRPLHGLTGHFQGDKGRIYVSTDKKVQAFDLRM